MESEGYRVGTLLSNEYKGLPELDSQALFRGKILEGFVRARADQIDGVHILLSVEAEDLEGWRWECLCGPTDAGGWEFLSLDQRASYSLYLKGSTSRDYRRITSQDLRVLLLVANPVDPENKYGLTPFDAQQNVARLRSMIECHVPTEVLAARQMLLGRQLSTLSSPSYGVLCGWSAHDPTHCLPRSIQARKW